MTMEKAYERMLEAERKKDISPFLFEKYKNAVAAFKRAARRQISKVNFSKTKYKIKL